VTIKTVIVNPKRNRLRQQRWQSETMPLMQY